MNYYEAIGLPKKLGIYVHIPFCLSKCAYCDFNSSVPGSKDYMSAYVSALIAHMESYRWAVGDGYQPDTVFIGGGTPTVLPPDDLFRLVRAIRRIFSLPRDAEFTVEANPATVTYSTLTRLRRMGVNRLSIGMQSAHENELKALGRIHDRHDFSRSFRMARDARFDNINVDVMFGIPEQTLDSLLHTLTYLTRYSPDHISLYDLKIEKGTKFFENYREIAPLLPGEDLEADMYLAAIQFLKDRGYVQYEISNFCHPGKGCLHNLKYWNCDEYLGFGVSAHSYFNGQRFSFTPDVEKYIEGVTVKDSRVRITAECEEIGERERIGEYIMLRLRLCDGIDDREFARRFGYSFEGLYGDKCRRYVQMGLMTMQGGTTALTPAGMFVSNTILSDILEFEDLGRGKLS